MMHNFKQSGWRISGEILESNLNETGHTQVINKKVGKANVYALKIQTMMTNGVPDCWYSGNKDDLWVEMKYISKLPKRDMTAIQPMLSDLQRNWLNSRYYEGRHVAVVIGSSIGWCIQETPPIYTAPILKEDLKLTRNEVVAWIIKTTNG